MPILHNMPQPLTSFVGREREIAEITRLLGAARLLTLTGPGGCGKTRLALHVAAARSEAFPDGVYFVRLAPIRDPQLVLATVAQTLRLKEAGQASLFDALQQWLGEQRLLLVLDNFEQVTAAAPAVAELLAACPGVVALVTSRAALRVYGEQEFSVPPLALPDPARAAGRLSVDDLLASEAIRLFLARAGAVQPGFRLTAENAAAVLGICRRLDGLPLAIELAAARSKVFAPPALLARLAAEPGGAPASPALQFLSAGARDLPARQQTLRGCIAWSYDLLTPWEQRLFWRLAAFAGGCTLEAATALMRLPAPDGSPAPADPDLAEAVLEATTSLIDKSLLTQRPDAGGEPRFTMLETIREFGGERLAASGEAASVTRQHATYYLTLAVVAEMELRSPQQLAWLNRLEAEHDNFRAAIAWALDTAEPETALRLAGTLGWFWHLRGQVSEGRDWLQRVLTGTPAAWRTSLRALPLTWAGVLAFRQSDPAAARPALEESIAISREVGDHEGRAYALAVLSLLILQAGDAAGARTALDESISIFRAAGNAWGLALALRNLGEVISVQGDPALRRALLEESVAIFRQIGDKWGLALALTNLSDTSHEVQDRGAIAAQIREGLALFEELGDRQGMAWCLVELGRVVGEAGAPARGAQLLGAADALLAGLGATPDPLNRAAYERSAAGIQSGLDAGAWAAALTAGRALSLPEARALAAAPLPDEPAAPATPAPGSVRPPGSPPAGPYPADLTAREVEVLRLTAAGLTDAEVAAQLTISRRTVQAHLRSIFSKLGTTNRTAATRFALEHHLT